VFDNTAMGEAKMAYAIVLEFTGVSQTRYDAGNEKPGIDMARGRAISRSGSSATAPVRRSRPRAACGTVRA
jgi:hypothetical protein